MFTTIITKFRNISTSLLLPLKFIKTNNNLIGGLRNGGINSLGSYNNLINNNNNINGKFNFTSKNNKIKNNNNINGNDNGNDNGDGDDGKMINYNINDLKFNDEKELNNNESRENFIFKNNYRLLKLFNGFTNDYVLIGGVKYKKINIVKVVLEHDSNNKFSNYLIQHYLAYHGYNSITLNNGSVINSNNHVQFIDIKSFNETSNKQISIENLIEKIECYYGNYRDNPIPLSLLPPSSSSPLFNLYKKLFNTLNHNDEITLHSIKMNKMDIGSLLTRSDDITTIDLLYNIELLPKSTINTFPYLLKEKTWLFFIDSIPIEILGQGYLSAYYYNLSLTIKSFTSPPINVKGKSMNKLDILLKSFDLNNQNHYAKKWIATYLVVTGEPSITLLNKKVLSLDRYGNDIIEDV